MRNILTTSATDATDGSDYYRLGEDDTVYIAPIGSLAVTGSQAQAIYVPEGIYAGSITVAGTVYVANGSFIDSVDGVNVTIGATGSVYGGIDASNAADDSNISNAGYLNGFVDIAGTGSGNYFNSGTMHGGLSAGGPSMLVNEGTIDASDTAVSIDAGSASASTILNSGTISGGHNAIYLATTADSILTNSGTIDGDILFYGGADYTLKNSGLISGDVRTGDGADLVVNAGRIVGDLSLAGGDDYFDGRSGSVAGAVQGGGGNDTLIGSNQADDTLDGGAGRDELNGGGGDDLASYASAGAAVTVDLADATQNSGDAKGDTLISIERLSGSVYNDHLGGDGNGNHLYGNDGNDTLLGRSGDDVLKGQSGNDTLDGGSGNDRLDGGGGANVASYADASKGVTVSLAISGAQATGGAGTDTLIAIHGLIGSDHDDRLLGSSGADTLTGGGGDDTLDGGRGADQLTGGSGKDFFLFDSKLDAIDTITDFAVGSDKIDLSEAIFTQFGKTGALAASAFHIGAGAHDSTDRIIYDNKSGALFYDDDGSGGHKPIEFAKLAAHLDLTAGDFIIVK